LARYKWAELQNEPVGRGADGDVPFAESTNAAAKVKRFTSHLAHVGTKYYPTWIS
jgi:hypothetical protein